MLHIDSHFSLLIFKLIRKVAKIVLETLNLSQLFRRTREHLASLSKRTLDSRDLLENLQICNLLENVWLLLQVMPTVESVNQDLCIFWPYHIAELRIVVCAVHSLDKK
jgi:hypothetical protein